jgi:hypothetical protein
VAEQPCRRDEESGPCDPLFFVALSFETTIGNPPELPAIFIAVFDGIVTVFIAVI